MLDLCGYSLLQLSRQQSEVRMSTQKLAVWNTVCVIFLT
jgi:hypothetical protein